MEGDVDPGGIRSGPPRLGTIVALTLILRLQHQWVTGPIVYINLRQ